MNKEYDDYKIISPDKMELIAKEYYKKLHESEADIPPKRQELNPQIGELLNYAQKNLDEFCKYCIENNLRERATVAGEINEKIKKMLSDFFGDISFDARKKENLTYCQRLLNAVKALCMASAICLKKQLCNEESEILKTSLEQIEMISTLFVPCKLRGWM